MNQLLLNQLKQNSVAVYVWKVHFTSSTYVSILKWLVFFIKFISWGDCLYVKNPLAFVRQNDMCVCWAIQRRVMVDKLIWLTIIINEFESH